MNEMEKITESLKKEAEEKKEKIIAEAEEKAERKKSKAQEKADEKSEEIINEGKREADAMEKRILSSAKTEARRKKLQFKDEMSEKVFKKAKEELDSLKNNQERYEKTIESLIIDGGMSVEGGDLEVLVPDGENFLSKEKISKLEEKISEETGNETSIKVLEELGESENGTIVRKSDGTVQCNNTFEARLNRMRDSLRTKVINILFENQ